MITIIASAAVAAGLTTIVSISMTQYNKESSILKFPRFPSIHSNSIMYAA